MTETNYDETKVPSYTLPPLLTTENGMAVETAFDWVNRRRPEILRTLQTELFGKLPPRPETCGIEVISVKEDALDNTAIRKEIMLTFNNRGRQHSFLMLLYIPQKVMEPVPVFLGLNFRGNHATTMEQDVRMTGKKYNGEYAETGYGKQESRWQFKETIRRGYASATVAYNDIFPDDKDENSWKKSIYHLFCSKESNEEFHSHGSAISAWAWGLSRMLDALENEPLVDTKKAMVHGHSRLGKTALWTGANDTRFRLVISNNSGCCGASLLRRRFGETLEAITHNFPHWFISSAKKYVCKEELLPFDLHWLVALSAPRLVCISSATEDLWADPKGEFLSGLHASEVYRLFGVKGMPTNEMPAADQPVTGEVSYHLRTGKHDQQLSDWLHYFEIADKFIR